MNSPAIFLNDPERAVQGFRARGLHILADAVPAIADYYQREHDKDVDVQAINTGLNKISKLIGAKMKAKQDCGYLKHKVKALKLLLRHVEAGTERYNAVGVNNIRHEMLWDRLTDEYASEVMGQLTEFYSRH